MKGFQIINLPTFLWDTQQNKLNLENHVKRFWYLISKYIFKIFYIYLNYFTSIRILGLIIQQKDLRKRQQNKKKTRQKLGRVTHSFRDKSCGIRNVSQKVGFALVWDPFRARLHETGTNSDRYQSKDFLKCLHETGMKLKPCSCKYFWSHSEFSLIPSSNAYLVRRIGGLSGEISLFHEESFVPIRLRTGLNSLVPVQHPKWVRPIRAYFSNRSHVN